MTDTALIKNFNDIKRLLIENNNYLKAIGLKTGALVLDEPKKSKPEGITKADMTPDELEAVNKWEKQCDEEMLTPKAVWEIQPNESYKDYAMRAISTAIDREALKTYGNDERLYTLEEVAQMIAEAREDTIAAERMLNA